MQEPFKQDDETTPVLFRISRAPKRDGSAVCAVFPCEPGNGTPGSMSCYEQVGQHGACSYGWCLTTRPATPAEYADLKRELESAPYRYRLKVCRRMTAGHRNALHAALRDLNDRAVA